MLKIVFRIAVMILLFVSGASAQVTTSGISGFVKSATGEALSGATVTATHLPTGSVYRTQTGKSGTYNIDNMNPGGPYIIEVTYVGTTTQKKSDVFLALGEASKIDFLSSQGAKDLEEVVVRATAKADAGKSGTSTIISREKLENMPTVGRNLYDYLRATPQIKIASSSNASSEGGLSIAGQNLRFNSFYVDGAVNNDVFGLAYSGTNGGQSSISPLSIDAIDQIQVLISPYDASIGNFTGGAINAITKSGTNQVHGSAYYIFRNQDLAGKTPTGPKDNATRYADFSNKTYGVTIGGPIIKNKLFYFISAELQRDKTPNPFNLSNYLGDTKDPATLQTLTDYIIANSGGYNPGIFTNSNSELKSDKITTKIDWNINEKNKLSVSYRYTGGDRLVAFSSTPALLQYSNYGYRFPTNTHSASAELKTSLRKGASNRLLLTFTDVKDDRGPLGGALAPNVTIKDGTGGSIRFGTEASSTFNYLKQSTYNLSDQFKFIVGKNTFTTGFEAEYYKAFNSFIQNGTGTYNYNSVQDFLNDAKPVDYRAGFPLIGSKDETTTDAAAKFDVFRGALFFNDEIKINPNLTISAGVRADYYDFITTPRADRFAIDSALPKFRQYYDLQGALPGQMAKVPVSLSPRLGITYKMPTLGLVFRGGAGLFAGRIPLVWPGGIYNNNGIASGSYFASGTSSALNTIRYRSTPYTAAEVGININDAKGNLDLIAKKFKMPKVFRTSLAVDKTFAQGWSVTVEALYTKNINDISYKNINLIPPTLTSAGPDNRKIYGSTTNNSTINIPIRSNGVNPYTATYLISNQTGDKGYSYNLTLTVNKTTRTGFIFSGSYNYGESYVVNDGQSSTNSSQWGNMESINGRNELIRGRSDNSAAHRIFAFASKKFTYANGNLATTIGFTYNGQSGLPFSYIYNGQAARDGINFYDLIYVPTATDIQNQTFQNLTVGSGASAVTYTVTQQKEALEKYIQNDEYLSSRRGKYAERNGSRSQFTNVVDMRVAQDFSVKVGKNRYAFQVIYSMMNFTNFLNRDWGHQYFTAFDQQQLLGVSYAAASNVPRYTFNPTTPTPGSVTTSVTPAYASRWTSQLEFRVRF